jgi:PPOX class probable F420-dependent enzyme
MATIPTQFHDLFHSKAFAHLATIRADGSPHVTPMWIDFDGTHVLINTAKGRAKAKQMDANPSVAVAIHDPANPYRYVEVRGRVVEHTERGADDHINALSKRYLGQDVYPFRQPGEVRVLYRIAPEHVHGQ